MDGQKLARSADKVGVRARRAVRSEQSLWVRPDPPDEFGGSYESECRPGGPYGAEKRVPRKSQIVIVSNRLPVARVRRGGSHEWQTSPGGLVSALTPILSKRPSRWIGWAGTAGAAPAPFEHEGIHNHPVRLSREEMETFYEGFCNRTLWPLYHDAVRTPEYRRRWWRPYVEVNRRFAEAAAETVAKRGTVWVHDYHM